MKRKMYVILLALLIITVAGCINRRVSPPEKRLVPGGRDGMPLEDKLVKSDDESVEENINAYLLRDDIRITKTVQGDEDLRISALNRQERLQILKKNSSGQKHNVLHEYATELPEGINDAILYNRYNLSYDYLVITAYESADVRKDPAPDADTVASVDNMEKVSLLQQVDGDGLNGSSIWYRVGFWEEDNIREGYIHSTEGVPRAFRFNRMLDAVNGLREQVARGPLNFISNYKNQNGAPPLKGEAAVDEYGYRVYHSAPAYVQADTAGDFRYIPDGMLVRVSGETNGLCRINVPTFGGDFYIPIKYIDRDATLEKINHVVVVDRSQQNQAVFEIAEKGLNLVSYTLSTTGFPGEFSFETTLGSYKAIEKKARFEYLKSASPDIAGYAPFAIRFTGGAYVHGVPVAYEGEGENRIDPGLVEYLHTIGTFPRSNMCVRNYTSHAKFLYNWFDYENGAIIVIE